MSINRAILLGNVGNEPDIRGSGDQRVASFRLATSEFWTDKQTNEKKEATEWHSVVVFNQALVGMIENHVEKGHKVAVEGMIKTRKWEKDGVERWSTEIVVGRFDGSIKLEGKPQGGGAGRRDEHSYGEARTRQPAGEQTSTEMRRTGLDDDIPF